MSTPPVSLPGPTTEPSRLAAINAALRELDPEAQVELDPEGGRMKVLTVLPPEDVVRVMQGLGETVELSGDEAEVAAPGRQGSCGCGCSSQRR